MRVPVTAKVQAVPGSRLILLVPGVPFKEASPATVRVRPPRPVKEDEVPLLMTKSPAVVVMSRPLKSKVPADCR